MIRNKFILIIVLVLMISIFTAGCADKLETKAGENTAENELDRDMAEDLLEDDVEKEEVYSGDGNGEEWPGELMDGIPQPSGRITKVSTPLNLRHITIESVKKKEALSFLDELKSLGFTEDPKELLRENSIVYVGDHEDGRRVSYKWDGQDKSIEIIYEARQ